MTILKCSALTKHFGSRTAVNQLSLEIEQGQIFGLLGPNGSGKTTTLGMLLGVTVPSGGEFTWFGDAPSAKSRTRIGAILESPSLYPNMSAYENLKVVAKIKNCSKDRIQVVLEEVGLLDRQHDKFQTYSLGMKQRLAIASALLSDPEVLILDEPTNGLDPEGIIEIRNIIIKIATSGKTIILASHLLDEVQKVCSHFAVLKSGKLLHQGAVDGISEGKVMVEIGAADMSALDQAIDSMSGVLSKDRQKDYFVIEVEPEVTPEYITKYLIGKDITPTHISQKQASLEQQFLNILSEND